MKPCLSGSTRCLFSADLLLLGGAQGSRPLLKASCISSSLSYVQGYQWFSNSMAVQDIVARHQDYPHIASLPLPILP